MMLDNILADDMEKNAKELEAIEKFFMDLNKPKNLGYSKNNYNIEAAKNFEVLCLILAENGLHGVKSDSIYEFITKTEYLENKNAKNHTTRAIRGE